MKKGKEKPQKQSTSMRIDADLQDRLNAVSDATGIAQSTLIRLSIKAIVEAFEETQVLPLPLKLRAVSLEERLSEITDEDKRKAS